MSDPAGRQVQRGRAQVGGVHEAAEEGGGDQILGKSFVAEVYSPGQVMFGL
mgnify:CR=1 FL=1